MARTPCCSPAKQTAFMPPDSTPPERTAWLWSPARRRITSPTPRYTEAAGRCVQGAEIREVGPGRGYAVLLTEALGEQKVCRLGFEEAYMTVLEHERYRKALPCELVPATELLQQLRTVKDAEELDAMVAAQRIAKKALDVILEEIPPRRHGEGDRRPAAVSDAPFRRGEHVL